LMPYMTAALELLAAGQKPRHIDGALMAFGMPMGPIELADYVGLDICLEVGRYLEKTLGDRFALPAFVPTMVERGYLGRKCEKGGFYRYERGRIAGINEAIARLVGASFSEKPREFDANIDLEDAAPMEDAAIQDRCLLPMLVEALGCLKEGIVKEPSHLDAAFVFGIGFPPFRGGLLRHFASVPREQLIQRIEALGLEAPTNLKVLDAFAD
ncbi:MAG: fatty oxidation complex subunit alpha, partial [Zetaproteobacteria bacterium]